ncbi:MAG: tetratricopeptide repeat protein [Blastocatellia bacterium]|nr:tetratricopeptide repeat protein [Blastocatellia bacterium]
MNVRKAAILSLLPLVSLTVFAFSSNAEGDQLFKAGNYQEAVLAYQREIANSQHPASLQTNLACALYRLGRYSEAIAELQKALQSGLQPAQAARAYYNLGNCYYSSKQRAEAIEAYKAALRLRPDDNLAKYNLEVALKQPEPPPPDPPKSSSSGGQAPDNNPDPNNKNKDKPNESPSQTTTPKMTQSEAERILEALRQNERGPAHRGNPDRSYFNTTIKRDW